MGSKHSTLDIQLPTANWFWFGCSLEVRGWTLNLKSAPKRGAEFTKALMALAFRVFAPLPLTSLPVRLLAREKSRHLFPSRDEERPAIIDVFVRG